MNLDCYDIIGIGIGPFNLSLAALTQPTELRTLFVDRKPEFAWHPGMQIAGTEVQVPYLADLVTMVDPTSPWSFLNYLRHKGRLFPFFFAERWHVPRIEYQDYCAWAASQIPSCRFGANVTSCGWDSQREAFVVEIGGETVFARNVVLGVGTEPTIPDAFRGTLGDRVLHSADYLTRRPALRDSPDVTVIGSGQSGAEVFLDLLQVRAPQHLRWITRTDAFAPMEYSKLGLEHFTPEYTTYFHSLPEPARRRAVARQWQLYKGISARTIGDVFDELYDRRVAEHTSGTELSPGVEVIAAHQVVDGIEMTCRHRQTEREYVVRTDHVVLATGYSPVRPAFLDALEGLIDWDERDQYRIDLNYRVGTDRSVTGGLYVQNAEMHTHGVGAPDLTLGAWRAAVIVNAVSGRPVIPLPEDNAFTSFVPPDSAP
ncbi:lysine N(6)-hydroxylase/L-ornithine N(5)-oxygenase family protein [Tsukamurella ocularis]|uniref:lysine N(6)-hydroxylase/L-ornithine N(5)-oxygenase family protein n=1 Tax=Tsukamurella ocularis TaxID=1970234 RepID=UPI002168C5CB|nr:SidA/IucD/PvdA family monooxygenase [Tsukamurella ocularis]MCS3780424.1 lysine N6-hydroxylase [Tsukamurella ocularis]MCS3786021.1 lysine N6-hydroxylase [Tsukamurella ocularis]MCS3849385.1 lysine N6-hydroxylase [Tsukamurella ocularis]